jgi:hypothetical protein
MAGEELPLLVGHLHLLAFPVLAECHHSVYVYGYGA